MPEYGWLVFYCALILLASMFGGWVPLVGKVTHSKLQFYLSLSAGVMLGAAFFHVMPDAMEKSDEYFGWWMSLGVVGLFCIERFIAPHSHEIDGHNHDHHAHEHSHLEFSEPLHKHEHGPVASNPGEKRAAAPAVAGWAAVFGLTVHTFMNGLGLAGAVNSGEAWMGAPGVALFLAIVLHKPADALAISTVLSRKGISRRRIFLVLLGFAAMIPVGVGAFYLIHYALDQGAQRQLVGAALAFSAGTFLFVALSDLLPEVQFHRHDRMWLFLALLSGVAFMGGIALLEGHEHGSMTQQLTALVRKLDQLTREPPAIQFDQQQKAKIADILKDIDEPAKLPEDDAKNKLDALREQLKDHKEKLKDAGLYWPDEEEPLPNPFKEGTNAEHLKALRERLTKDGLVKPTAKP